MVQNKGKRHSDHPFDLLNTVSGFLDLTKPAPPSTQRQPRAARSGGALSGHFSCTGEARNEPSTNIECVVGYVGADG